MGVARICHVAMDTRTPSPLRKNKRRLIKDQDSISEPPRKSPAAGLFDEAGQRFRFDSEYVSKIGLKEEECYSSAPFPSPVVGLHKEVKTEPDPAQVISEDDKAILEAGFCKNRERRNSKDILDEYFARRTSRSRRRSSCIEVGLLQNQTKEGDPENKGEIWQNLNLPTPVPEKVHEECEALSDTELESCTKASQKLSFQGRRNSRFSRSLSAEGYDPEDLRDRKQETQALLFDSTPDLTIEENYTRFPSLRSSRRGAVCYDIHAPLVSLRALNLDDC